MGKISTKELLDNFFSSTDVVGTSIEKNRRVIDRPELYNYESTIRKELIDMDVDDLFGLIQEFTDKKDGRDVPFMTSHNSYDQITGLLRKIFNFYTDTVEPIKNPLYDKRMKGRQATERLREGKEALRWSYIEEIINEMHNDLLPDKADYVELIILLFYCGFEKAEEIVYLKENMINHKNKTIALQGRIIHLTDRCYSLLVKFHNQDMIEGWQKYVLVGWHGSYFKFIVRASQIDAVDERPAQIMSDALNRLLSTNINKKYNTKINYSTVYWLGFYEFLVRRYGESETNQMVTSVRNPEYTTKLISSASEYGINKINVTHIKRYLRPYVANS